MSSDDFMSLEDAARYLGISVEQLRNLVRRRKIAHYKLPGMSRDLHFKKADLNAWLESGRINPKD